MATSFATDIAPILTPYRDNMIWRFDLADYGAVRANAKVIQARITPTSDDPMPPPPLPPISAVDITMFNAWVDEGCPP